jgi:hypothetical protein
VPIPTVYVPLSAIFPQEPADFAAFCATVRTLSRTDTIFWCARLNLIVSNPQNADEGSKQRYCIGHFFDAQEIERGKDFAKEYPSATPFYREQLLELMRWVCLLADDLPNDGQTFRGRASAPDIPQGGVDGERPPEAARFCPGASRDGRPRGRSTDLHR